jgi:hypothetical protein
MARLIYTHLTVSMLCAIGGPYGDSCLAALERNRQSSKLTTSEVDHSFID